ncbi:MAG: hypothetical protein KME60_31145 [Cyanomargarita calcarea GSE-NOS-MK-12-04C]|jgi:hypothetical protein|uniref:Uncharacterized protein n=1 Tax=Cyanomargarita calcarea GSE-NOS-MK-12-04C TaxID=2839659 RepID=A0A951QTY0_9CYAN|nr:hypothetical protein [Cyanomargarita calcarea GSE-NOS-MK-12-04C]
MKEEARSKKEEGELLGDLNPFGLKVRRLQHHFFFPLTSVKFKGVLDYICEKLQF